MNLAMLRDFLLWCLVINYAVLVVWFLVFLLAHDWLYRLHSRWFRIPVEQFDAIHYVGISVYKIGVILFNLAPWLALLIIGRCGGG